MSGSAVESFSITRRMEDLRADGATRMVRLDAKSVTIDRAVGGIRMRVGVPVATYRCLVISVQASGTRALLTLRHEDGELDVVIGSGEAVEVARSARAWSAVLGKPVEVEEACVRVGAAFPRQRRRAKPSRLSRFARRRKTGVGARMETCHRGEREIIAGDRRGQSPD